MNSQQYLFGITPGPNMEYSMLRDAGIQWIRTGAGFPLASADNDTVPQWTEKAIGHIRRLKENGFEILCGTFGPGSKRYDGEIKKTIWKQGIPDWAGTHESDSYYSTLERAGRRLAELTAGLVRYWQISNEPDIDIFRGPLSEEQIARFLIASAAGIKQGNPDAKTGINIGELTDFSKRLLHNTYVARPDLFDYIGLDGYFGSWQPGGPEKWPVYIEDANRITGKPVIINEWGYSSLGSSPKTDDPDLVKPYNQDVCRDKRWKKVWKDGHTPEVQAEYITECMRIFTGHPKVIGNFFFKWSDDAHCWQCGQPDCPAECAWGLVDVNGRPKPAYGALRTAIRSAAGMP